MPKAKELTMIHVCPKHSEINMADDQSFCTTLIKLTASIQGLGSAGQPHEYRK
jgi:hypothetical protein